MYRLTYDLAALLQDARITQEDFALLTGIKERRVAALVRGGGPTLRQSEIRAIRALARRQATRGKAGARACLSTLDVVPDPVWSTFRRSRYQKLILRGAQATGDSKTETILREHLKFWIGGTPPTSQIVQKSTPVDSIRSMCQERNVIALCSPFRNPATEILLEALFPSEEASASTLPVSFGGISATSKSASSDTANGRGIEAETVDGGSRFFACTFIPDDEEYLASSGPGTDCALLVYCRKPLGTDKSVATMILAGASDFSTQVLTNAVLTGEAPMGRRAAGRAAAWLLEFGYMKRADADRKDADESSKVWHRVKTE